MCGSTFENVFQKGKKIIGPLLKTTMMITRSMTMRTRKKMKMRLMRGRKIQMGEGMTKRMIKTRVLSRKWGLIWMKKIEIMKIR